jgi:hypothetical protein
LLLAEDRAAPMTVAGGLLSPPASGLWGGRPAPEDIAV